LGAGRARRPLAVSSGIFRPHAFRFLSDARNASYMYVLTVHRNSGRGSKLHVGQPSRSRSEFPDSVAHHMMTNRALRVNGAQSSAAIIHPRAVLVLTYPDTLWELHAQNAATRCIAGAFLTILSTPSPTRHTHQEPSVMSLRLYRLPLNSSPANTTLTTSPFAAT
jgi:hypothetical protein